MVGYLARQDRWGRAVTDGTGSRQAARDRAAGGSPVAAADPGLAVLPAVPGGGRWPRQTGHAVLPPSSTAGGLRRSRPGPPEGRHVTSRKDSHH